MGRYSASAVAVVAALAVAAPARAAAPEPELTLDVSQRGSVSASWHGDPARGCEEAGLCGYRGAVSARAEDAGGYEGDGTVVLGLTGPYAASLDTIGPYDEPSVARVVRTEADGSTGGCADAHSRSKPFSLRIARLRGGRLRVGLVVSGHLPGRCAGPRIDNGLAGLPARTIRVPRKGRSSVVTLNGRVPYASGRFSGVVASRLRVRIERIGSSSFPLLRSEAPRERPRRSVFLRARYRISGFSGSSSAVFQGLAEPGCLALEACGAAGSASWAIEGGEGLLDIEGYAPARRSDRGLAGAVAAIVRDGGASVASSGGLRATHAGTTSAELRRVDGAACRDTQPAAAPPLLGEIASARFHIAFAPNDESADVDILRTGCAGPLRYDVLGGGAAALGSVPASWLASRRRFTVRLGSQGAFTGLGYRGTHETRVTFVLERVSAKATYRKGPKA